MSDLEAESEPPLGEIGLLVESLSATMIEIAHGPDQKLMQALRLTVGGWVDAPANRQQLSLTFSLPLIEALRQASEQALALSQGLPWP